MKFMASFEGNRKVHVMTCYSQNTESSIQDNLIYEKKKTLEEKEFAII